MAPTGSVSALQAFFSLRLTATNKKTNKQKTKKKHKKKKKKKKHRRQQLAGVRRVWADRSRVGHRRMAPRCKLIN
jgi:hypothetical protein